MFRDRTRFHDVRPTPSNRPTLPAKLLAALLLSVVLALAPSLSPLSLRAAAPASDVSSIQKERAAVERNLRELKKQLQQYQSKLNATKKRESRSLKQLQNLRKQILVLEKLIVENQRYLKQLDADIRRLGGELQENRSRYGSLSEAFSRTAVAVYKYGRSRESEHIFAAGSVNEALARARYIGFFSQAVGASVAQLQDAAGRLEESKASLESSFRKKSDAVKEQERKLKNLASAQSEKEVVLKKLKKDKQQYAAQVAEAQRKRRKLQGRIESLIAAEQRAIEAERERQRQRDLAAGKQAPPAGRRVPPPDPADLLRVSDNFDKALGRLPWPVSNGVVTQKFGTARDKELQIVTKSNGIDISVPENTPVRSVSGGKVAQIAFLPTFGNIVLVRHTNSYMTVYANLGQLRVVKDELIASQQVIGLSGKMAEGGSVVHFEIWKGRVMQDPEKWLRR